MLKSIPNVKLISHDEQTKLLIKKSLGIITLTSTVGFEALVMGKYVIVLGNEFYDLHPRAIKLPSLENLGEIIRLVISKKSENITAKDVKSTIFGYYDNTFSLESIDEAPKYIAELINNSTKDVEEIEL